MKTYPYYRLQISLKGAKDRLYRELLFPYGETLDALAVTVISSFNTRKGEPYEFADQTRRYYSHLPSRTNNTRVKAIGVPLSDLSLRENTFTMDYYRDQFEITVLCTLSLDENYEIPRVTKGAGYGVATEGMSYLTCYLNGTPLPRPITFWRSGKAVALDFDTFDPDACNEQLRREFSNLRQDYDTELL